MIACYSELNITQTKYECNFLYFLLFKQLKDPGVKLTPRNTDAAKCVEGIAKIISC